MSLRIALVVPHTFMHREILPHVIFSPGHLAISLADQMQSQGMSVTLFTPGPVSTLAKNVTTDLGNFEALLAEQESSYIDFLKKSPLAFISMARQTQNELIADVYDRANRGEFDLVHVYTNEEEQALSFSRLCKAPTAFTHHDPFNLSTKYRAIFPRYSHVPWLSISDAQRNTMPLDTHWVDTIYHGIKPSTFAANYTLPKERYVAYFGRIIKNKGVHLAIQATLLYNEKHPDNPLTLKIAGKHYSGHKDIYWQKHIEPLLDNKHIEYLGFIKNNEDKQDFLSNAEALLVPSLFEEPFGMVMIEALACGTPIIGLDSGAIPEVVTNDVGIVIEKDTSEAKIIEDITSALSHIKDYDRHACRKSFENLFTLDVMAAKHIAAYQKVIKSSSK